MRWWNFIPYQSFWSIASTLRSERWCSQLRVKSPQLSVAKVIHWYPAKRMLLSNILYRKNSKPFSKDFLTLQQIARLSDPIIELHPLMAKRFKVVDRSLHTSAYP